MLDHMLSSSSGVDVEPKLGWIRSFRPDESVVHELRIVIPVIRVWMAMFVALVFVADAPGWDSLEYMLLTHCAVGVFMTTIWTSFYGSATWKRFATALGLVLLTSLLGVLLKIFIEGADSQIWALVWIPVFVMLAGLIPAIMARRFWGWCIFHVRDMPESVQQKQFTLRDALTWTAFVAVLCTLARIIVSLLGAGDNGWRVAVILYIGVGVPLLAMMSFLSMVSRLRFYWLLFAIPVLSACIAVLVSIPIGIDNGFDFVINEFFRPTQFWFMIAGFVLMGVIIFLQRRGLVFAFGACDGSDFRDKARMAYVTSLRRRIDRHNRRKLELQSELDLYETPARVPTACKR